MLKKLRVIATVSLMVALAVAASYAQKGSTGRLLTGKVFDHNDNPVPNGTTGEIIACGPQLMKGYWRRPEETAEAFRFEKVGGKCEAGGDAADRFTSACWLLPGRFWPLPPWP